MKKVLKHLGFKLVYKLAFWLISTLKFRKIDDEDIKIFSKPSIIVSFHEEVVFVLYLTREVAFEAYKKDQTIKQISSMASSSKDGDIIDNLAKSLFKKIPYTKPYLVRGSSNKNPLRALAKIISASKISSSVLTVDGPRGPRGKVKPGAILAAIKNNIPIYCYRFNCRGKRINSWDKTIIPKPFSKINKIKSGPFYFDNNTDVEQACQIIEKEMNKLKIKLNY